MEKRVLGNLAPKIVWSIFEDITKIPRPSTKEEKIRGWVKSWANENSIPSQEDDAGNILLMREASSGCENYPTLVLQAHTDMVCQKTADREIDFEKDPIKIKIEDGKVTAEGTTLGADNGIGMALGMAALIEDDLKHGPLELLLTVNEEAGFTGASGMKPGFFSGKYLLNLDSEALGEMTIGSAGGGNTTYHLTVTSQEREGWAALKLSMSGLTSGHSGIHIHLPRLNAIRVVSDGMKRLKETLDVLLAGFEGGAAVNVIPANAAGVALVHNEHREEAIKILGAWKEQTIAEARQNEPNIAIEITSSDEKKAYTAKQTEAILAILSALPHGALSFSEKMEGLVQTSNNLAMVKSSKESVDIFLNSRSSSNDELRDLRARLKRIGGELRAEVEQDEPYPGWDADPDAPFTKVVKEAHEGLLTKGATLQALHAGLECGVFLNSAPDLQMASIGPTITGAHSPDESVDIESVEVLWNILRRIIEKMNTLE